MPIFDYLCLDCNAISEILITGTEDKHQCLSCGSQNLKRLLSAPSSLSGASKHDFPSSGDTACCGSSPDMAGCAGPGSCCGKRPY